MAEYAVLPERALHVLPEGITTRHGALVEPLAVTVHGVQRSALKPGERALVMGAGPIGLLTLQCAFVAGAREVYVSEVDPGRANLAVQLGASAVFDPTTQNLAVELMARTEARIEGEGPSVADVCTGAAAALEDAVTLVCKGGRILVLGLGVEPLAADFLTLVLHELDIKGSYLGYEEFPVALEYLAQGRGNVEKLITHEIALDDVVAQGFQVLEEAGRGAVKVLVKTFA
jgi:(R,R)-butanediol dehydrogenase/meso-butanediol dehydrogenase/diacetyl reductase